MKVKLANVIENYKENLEIRLENNNKESESPYFSATNIEYDISGRVSAIHCGGIGIVDQIVKQVSLPEMINNRLNLLKRHKPYFESDHILNIAYNIICGGACLEDIELLRNNLPYMNALGATRIPDPTTAGDFLRRFTTNDVCTFMDVLNVANTKIWDISLNKEQRRLGIIDVDGTIQETYGKCKEGMDMSYNGKWGFAPLVLTEATTGSHLFIVNRSGNKLSQDGAGEWMDKSIKVVKKIFDVVCLRGDSAFSLIEKFDEWTEKKTRFIFGYNAFQTLINKAELLEESEWKRLDKPQNDNNEVIENRIEKNRVKNDVVIRREYETQRQKDEHVAEFIYRPTKCESDYRVIVLRKKIEVTKGQLLLFETYRYFFYITNIWDKPAIDLLHFIRGRCNHENKIEQLDNGIHALKMPASEFIANWAYMAIVTLAWNIKSWLGLLINDKEKGDIIVRSEFKSFQNRIINLPCQIINTGRRIVYRFLNYNTWVEILFSLFEKVKRLKFSTV